MRDGHSRDQRREQFVIVPVTATGLVADGEAIGRFFKHVYHLVHLPHLQSLNDFSVVVQDTNANVLAVNIESNVKCKLSLERRDRETGTNNTFYDTRSTEASFIVSVMGPPGAQVWCARCAGAHHSVPRRGAGAGGESELIVPKSGHVAEPQYGRKWLDGNGQPRPALGPEQWKICVLLSMGLTRRQAAKYAGCHHATIARWATRGSPRRSLRAHWSRSRRWPWPVADRSVPPPGSWNAPDRQSTAAAPVV